MQRVESRGSMSCQAGLFILSEATANPIPEAKRVTVTGRATATFQVYAGDPTRVQVHHDAELERASYAWGNVAHASVPKGDALLRWIGQAADDASPMKLRELHGHFVVVIDDRRRGTISFVSDVLGLRPWYVNTSQGRLIAGSDVPALCRAGLSAGEVDYDAVASWLQYNFDCTGGSIRATTSGWRPAPSARMTRWAARPGAPVCFAGVRPSASRSRCAGRHAASTGIEFF